MAKRLGPPRESWIASSDHDKHAAAMMKCQHGDPSFCTSLGECVRGHCFDPAGVTCAECNGRGWIPESKLKRQEVNEPNAPGRWENGRWVVNEEWQG